MNDLIAEMIHTSKGYFHETSGLIIGFFNDAQQARYCANQITSTTGKAAQVCGSQFSISL